VYLIVDPEVKIFLDGDHTFDFIMAMHGEIYRALEGRCTQRIELGGQGYFLKQHRGVGWKEIIKNLLQLRLPVLGAKNEWRAVQRLCDLGIATMQVVAYGQRGWNPAHHESFLLTRELVDTVSLEDLSREWLRHLFPYLSGR
jgi:heptose I phosphotransferase